MLWKKDNLMTGQCDFRPNIWLACRGPKSWLLRQLRLWHVNPLKCDKPNIYPLSIKTCDHVLLLHSICNNFDCTSIIQYNDFILKIDLYCNYAFTPSIILMKFTKSPGCTCFLLSIVPYFLVYLLHDIHQHDMTHYLLRI